MAVATMQTQTLVLVKITTEDGYVGWGEATTIGGLGYGEESPESVKTNIDTYFAPLLKTLTGLNVAQTCTGNQKSISMATALPNVPFRLPYWILGRNVSTCH